MNSIELARFLESIDVENTEVRDCNVDNVSQKLLRLILGKSLDFKVHIMDKSYSFNSRSIELLSRGGTISFLSDSSRKTFDIGIIDRIEFV